MARLFFATDIHGSDICWKKFLNAARFYDVNTLILGGDMTGKALVPIFALPDGTFYATLLQQEFVLDDEAAVVDMERKVASRGYYPFRVNGGQIESFRQNPALVEQFFHEQMHLALQRWLAIADEKLTGSGIRCVVSPGNDDPFEIDELLSTSKHVTLGEGRAIEIGDGFTVISSGWANVTPWHTYRELPEDRLYDYLKQMIPADLAMDKVIFNFHCPPHASNLDEAPEIDEQLNVINAGHTLVPVGSTAVRRLIEEYQPVLSLHGHIHEGKGTTRIGRTLAINAGSMYEQGVLQGVVIDLDPNPKKGFFGGTKSHIRSYTLTTG
ncbi:MAG: metallophosphoesterase [Roseiflexaceae bacterium]|nr:metallophosphoesterase [Chloroflexaceae bacterium]